MTFAVRRAREHVGRLSLLALIAALVVSGIGGSDAVAERMLTTGASRIFAEAEPTAKTVRVVAGAAPDAEAQDAAVRAAIDRAFAGTDIVVSQQATAEVEVRAEAGEGPSAEAGARSGAEISTQTGEATVQASPPFTVRLLDDARVAAPGAGLARLTGGAWPQAAGQIALPEAAAARQHLAVGDRLVVAAAVSGNGTGSGTAAETGADAAERAGAGAVLTVVGVWTADDPAAPAWQGDPSVVSGSSDDTIGPAIVAEGALGGTAGPNSTPPVGTTPKLTWEVAPGDALTEAIEIPALQRALTRLDSLPETVDPQRQHNTRVLGDLGETLQRQSTALAATRGLLIAPQLIIGLLGALVLGILFATLTIARAEELALLRARGASARGLALAGVSEATGCAAVGALTALGLLAVTTGLTRTAMLTAAGALLFVALAAGIFVLRQVAGTVPPPAQRSDAGARSLPALLLPVAAAIGLAALSAWQLFAAGTVVRRDGTADPFAAAAPALLLVAACGLAPVAAGLIAAGAERLLRRTRGIAPILPVRQVARRIGGAAIAILCLALAAAAVTVAVAAPAIADAAEQRTRTALLGGDLRAISEDGFDVSAGSVAGWSGVTRAALVLRTPLTVGSDSVALIAGPPSALGGADLGPAGSDAADRTPAAITRSLAQRIGAGEGTVFTARVRSVARPVPIEVARIVDTIPGVGDGWGVAISTEALRAAGADLAGNELWVQSDSPADTAARLLARTTHPIRILTAAQVSAAPVTSVAPAMLAVGALIAAVLGCIGFLAASSATARARRDEPFVLRALGLRPAQRRALRIGETAGVALYAVLAGAVLGGIVAAAVLPVVLGVEA